MTFSSELLLGSPFLKISPTLRNNPNLGRWREPVRSICIPTSCWLPLQNQEYPSVREMKESKKKKRTTGGIYLGARSPPKKINWMSFYCIPEKKEKIWFVCLGFWREFCGVQNLFNIPTGNWFLDAHLLPSRRSWGAPLEHPRNAVMWINGADLSYYWWFLLSILLLHHQRRKRKKRTKRR